MRRSNDIEAVFEGGVENLHMGRVSEACKIFRAVLDTEPKHPDAHSHLGLIAMEQGELAEAEQHLRVAVEESIRRTNEPGERGYGDREVYLRALQNLALVRRLRGDYKEAIGIHERMLKLDERDGLGARYLLAEEYHHQGARHRAIRLYDSQLEYPPSCFGLGLALLETKSPAARMGKALLRGFAANRYMAPMLLDEAWEPLNGFHGNDRAEAEFAEESVHIMKPLWQRVPGSLEVLRTWWGSPSVVGWRVRLDQIAISLKGLEFGDARITLVSLRDDLEATDYLDFLVSKVLGVG
jgi:tetratricopeptide (TPR) repeat protein